MVEYLCALLVSSFSSLINNVMFKSSSPAKQRHRERDKKRAMRNHNRETALFLCAHVLVVVIMGVCGSAEENYASAVGDPGMRRDGLRVAFEAWNFCNEVGQEAPLSGSPRAADCFDLSGIV